ncbi:DUF3996 domain-containing protein [Candidatus Aerophobetes bacterium]|nr:DUF3996 domain-containing protein [Candidatus Aerophobetes bacterium]
MAAFFFSSTAGAQEKGFGIGIILGEPTGICFKKWMDENTAFAGAVAWSLFHPSALHVHLDYLFHRRVQRESYFFHYGIGGRIKFEEGESRIGVRIPLGITYPFQGTTVDMFVEISPLLDLAPATEFGVNAAIGFRYFFE